MRSSNSATAASRSGGSRPPMGAEWFDENGRSLRRNFLRTPLDGARVTSGFGQRRHPVLGFTRMHQGIDFAAPTGTPVLAAADGVVTRAGFAGGYGRIIQLQHPDGTETRYAHLSGFARGLRQGQPGQPGSGHRPRRLQRHGDRPAPPLRNRRGRPPGRPGHCPACRDASSWPAPSCKPSSRNAWRSCRRSRIWSRSRKSPGRSNPPRHVPSRRQAAAASGCWLTTSPSVPVVTVSRSPSWIRPSSSRLASWSCSARWITRFSGRAP